MWFNIWPVIIAAIASMILGMIWYGPLFGELWMKLSGLTKKDQETAKKKGMTAHMVAAFLGSVVMAFAMDMLFQALRVTNIGAAWAIGLIIWIGFMLTLTMSSVLWEGKPFALYALNNAYNLVNMMIVSSIVAVY